MHTHKTRASASKPRREASRDGLGDDRDAGEHGGIRPIFVLRFWISEDLTQAES